MIQLLQIRKNRKKKQILTKNASCFSWSNINKTTCQTQSADQYRLFLWLRCKCKHNWIWTMLKNRNLGLDPITLFPFRCEHSQTLKFILLYREFVLRDLQCEGKLNVAYQFPFPVPLSEMFYIYATQEAKKKLQMFILLLRHLL